MVQAWPQTLGPATMAPYRSPTQYNHQLLTANRTSRPTTCKTINPHTTRGLILSGEPSSTSGATNHLQIIHLHCKQGSIDVSGNASPHTTGSRPRSKRGHPQLTSPLTASTQYQCLFSQQSPHNQPFHLPSPQQPSYGWSNQTASRRVLTKP